MAASLARAAAVLRDAELVSILHALDADSVLAAGQVAAALHRAGVPWHARPCAGLTTEALAPLAEEAPGQPLLLCGLGGRDAGVLDAAAGEVLVLDARYPRLPGKHAVLLEDALPGATAASLGFDLARALDPRAPALPALAGLEAAGADGAEGLRARLADEALAAGAKAGPVPALGPGPLVEALAGCVEPYLPGLSGRARGSKKFLEGLGVPDAPVEELPAEAAGKLASALTLHLLARGCAAAAPRPLLAPDLRGTWPGGSARGLARLCAAAVHANRGGLALTLAMGDPRGERDALALVEARHQRLLQSLLKLEGDGAASGPLRADPDLAADLAWASAAVLRGGEPVAAVAEPTRLHVAAPGTDARFLGQAAFEAAQAAGGTGSALGPRAVLDVPAGKAPQAWDHLKRSLGVLA